MPFVLFVSSLSSWSSWSFGSALDQESLRDVLEKSCRAAEASLRIQIRELQKKSDEKISKMRKSLEKIRKEAEAEVDEIAENLSEKVSLSTWLRVSTAIEDFTRVRAALENIDNPRAARVILDQKWKNETVPAVQEALGAHSIEVAESTALDPYELYSPDDGLMISPRGVEALYILRHQIFVTIKNPRTRQFDMRTKSTFIKETGKFDVIPRSEIRIPGKEPLASMIQAARVFESPVEPYYTELMKARADLESCKGLLDQLEGKGMGKVLESRGVKIYKDIFNLQEPKKKSGSSQTTRGE